MKKLVLLLAAVAVLAAMPLRAADISVGATTWYSWWDMKDATEDIDPGILYGPAFAVKFNENFNLNFVFLYGEYDAEQTGLSSYTYKRYDSDTSIGYRLNDYFKFFAGLKYNAYTSTIDTIIGDIDLEVQMYGPAAGLSAVIPLGYDFFILANGSGMYLTGSSEQTGALKAKDDCKGYGYNTAGSLAYYITSASVTLSLGGRYQYIKLNWDDSNTEDSKMSFYGITAAATYSFAL